jgi:hypothetical protein
MNACGCKNCAAREEREFRQAVPTLLQDVQVIEVAEDPDYFNHEAPVELDWLIPTMPECIGVKMTGENCGEPVEIITATANLPAGLPSGLIEALGMEGAEAPSETYAVCSRHIHSMMAANRSRPAISLTRKEFTLGEWWKVERERRERERRDSGNPDQRSPDLSGNR